MVQVGVGAVVAAGTLLSELDLQALDHTVLLLQLFGQPDDGDEEEEEEEDLGGGFTKKKGEQVWIFACLEFSWF